MSAPVIFLALLVVTGLPAASADCPDADVRCRIPLTDKTSQYVKQGCEGGGQASGSTASKVIGFEINGKCFYTQEKGGETSYVVVGNVKIGKCFSFPSCNPCRGSLAEECATRLSECVACTMGCLKEHVVKPGDDCSSIAKANSLALDAVKALNPGVCGPWLQDNTKLCLVFGKTDDCKRVCEGTEI